MGRGLKRKREVGELPGRPRAHLWSERSPSFEETLHLSSPLGFGAFLQGTECGRCRQRPRGCSSLLSLLDVAVCRIFMGPQSLEVPLRFQWIPGRCGQGASARPSFHFFITYIFWRALICQALFPRAMYPVTPWSLCGPSGPPRREASGGLPCRECTCIISDVIL